MEEYTLHCTSEQTKKALELGAPIDAISSSTNEDITTISCFKLDTPIYTDIIEGGFDYALNPTAEQLIGWLEEQEGIKCIEIYRYPTGIWRHAIDGFTEAKEYYNTRKEATLAAIDAALDYLIKKK